MLPIEILLMIYGFCDKLTRARMYMSGGCIRAYTELPYLYQVLKAAIMQQDLQTLIALQRHIPDNGRLVAMAAQTCNMKILSIVANRFQQFPTNVGMESIIIESLGVAGVQFLHCNGVMFGSDTWCALKIRAVTDYMIHLGLCETRTLAVLGDASPELIEKFKAIKSPERIPSISATIQDLRRAHAYGIDIKNIYRNHIVIQCQEDAEFFIEHRLESKNLTLYLIQHRLAELLSECLFSETHISDLGYALSADDMQWLADQNYDISGLFPCRSVSDIVWYQSKHTIGSNRTNLRLASAEAYVYLVESGILPYDGSFPYSMASNSAAHIRLLQQHMHLVPDLLRDWVSEDYSIIVECLLQLNYEFPKNITASCGQKCFRLLYTAGYRHYTDTSKTVKYCWHKNLKLVLQHNTVPCLMRSSHIKVDEILARHRNRYFHN